MIIKATQLRWDHLESDIAAGKLELAEPFDCICGTDVIFRKSLVKPLLQTLHRLSHVKTSIYICIQERCQDAHKYFLKKAQQYFKITDITPELSSTSGCHWGVHQLESRLFVLREKVELTKKKRKRRTSEMRNKA